MYAVFIKDRLPLVMESFFSLQLVAVSLTARLQESVVSLHMGSASLCCAPFIFTVSLSSWIVELCETVSCSTD